ncbi:MAG: hypothetical protein PWP70_1552 [Moorella sp. (in: firmicutes)]|nr:hypothetical protein [Moorella sp. (in: firmicutes)]
MDTSKQLIKKVVLKTLLSKIEEINHKLADLKTSLGYFEKKYGMATEAFYHHFIEGSLEDEMDFFEWKTTKEMYDELKAEKDALLEILK